MSSQPPLRYGRRRRRDLDLDFDFLLFLDDDSLDDSLDFAFFFDDLGLLDHDGLDDALDHRLRRGATSSQNHGGDHHQHDENRQFSILKHVPLLILGIFD
jgi:hypothetical protein